MDDLYSTLGVAKTATAEEIKKAYRNLAFKYHPDRNQGDQHAEEQFKKINAAYSVLGDEVKRRQYDLYGQSEASSSGGSSYGRTGYGRTAGTGSSQYGYSGDPFSDFFGGYGFDFGSYGRSSRPGSSSSGGTDRERNWQNSYTWTSRTTGGAVSRSEGMRRFCNGAVKAFIGFGAFRFLFWFFPINIISLIAGIHGAVDALGSLKYIFAGKEGN